MAPESHCLSREGFMDSHQSFMTRVLALPAVDQAAAMYRVTKEQQPYVGVALRLAEAGIMRTVTATGAIIPLATPIANHVDVLACQVLDNVVKVAPIITKPTDEIVDDTRHFVMRSIAGGQHHSKPLTLKTALVARASEVVDRASATDYGRALIHLAESLLHSAHYAVDTCLPPSESDMHHADGNEGDLSTKALSLAYKTQSRLVRTAKRMLRADGNGNEEDDDIVIYPLHLVENGNHRFVKWYFSLVNIPYVKKASSATTAARSIVVKNVGFVFDTTIKYQRILSTMVSDTASNVYSVIAMNGKNAVGYFSTSRVHLEKSLATAAKTASDAAFMAGLVVHVAFSTAVFTTSAITNTSRDIVKTALDTAVSITSRTIGNFMTLGKTLPGMEMSKKSQQLFQSVQATFLGLKAQGIVTFIAAEQYCTETMKYTLRRIPPSLSTRGSLLYTQSLSTFCALRQYPSQVLESSSQILQSARHIPLDSYVWLRNSDLYIQSYLLAVQIQSRLLSLLSSSSLSTMKVKTWKSNSLAECKKTL
ncbi:uncharacterized protein [Palaemon carinicauda]|uniref:uncharacterized protein n=1 Tax=Palaemon carinicauda TaxID=392227 RepID=UPI0035B69C6D